MNNTPNLTKDNNSNEDEMAIDLMKLLSADSSAESSNSEEPLPEDLAEAFNDALVDGFQEGYYIGIMSGTSLDALDVVIVKFDDSDDLVLEELLAKKTDEEECKVELIATHSKQFDANLRTVLLSLCQTNDIMTVTKQELNITDTNLTDTSTMSELDWFGWASCAYAEFASEVVAELLTKVNLDTDSILAIGCHGQTVRHRPELGFTLQLVDPNIIAERTGITTVTDFRRRDMAVGGQGAPLVPAFHQAIFADNIETRVIINLGGIANITILQSNDNASTDDPLVGGYDTGPANLLLDAWVEKHLNTRYDQKGEFARSGKIIAELLDKLLTHPFFSRPAPKSTGREDFHLNWLEQELDSFTHQNPHISFSPADIQATLTELTAKSIAKKVVESALNGSAFVCGGGAYNEYLLARLQLNLDILSVNAGDWQLQITSKLGLQPMWVEATAFAWLARQTLMGRTGNIPEVTGATRAVVLGQVCFG